MSIGIWQVVLILVIVLIIFGAGKLPKVMGDVAAGVKNFKQGMKEDDDEPKAAQVDQRKHERSRGHHRAPRRRQGRSGQELKCAVPRRRSERRPCSISAGPKWRSSCWWRSSSSVPRTCPRWLATIGQWTGKARALARDFQRSLDDMAREAELDEIKKSIDKVGNTSSAPDRQGCDRPGRRSGTRVRRRGRKPAGKPRSSSSVKPLPATAGPKTALSRLARPPAGGPEGSGRGQAAGASGHDQAAG